MSYEDYLDRKLEQERKKQNESTAESLKKLSERRAIKLESFRTEENSREINRDLRYVEGSKLNFDEDKSYEAKALESIFYFNVARGNWLSDIEGDSFTSEAVMPAEYDDIRNRIDIATTIHTTEGNRTFGIDVTTNPDEDVIRKKILFASNDPDFEAPAAGFGQLKYYADSTGPKGKLSPIPRYCIGINKESVNNILDSTSASERGLHFGKLHPIEQFKILHEMAVQNELFETPLYAKEDDGTLTEEEEQCLRYIETLDTIYLVERERIVNELKAQKSWALEFGDDFDSIAKRLTTPSSDTEPDETFASILAVTEELYQESCDSEDPDELKKSADRYKRRNTGIVHQELGNSSVETARKLA